MAAITSCEACGSDIWADDVFKTVPIPDSVGYKAAFYTCPICKAKGKMAIENKQWNVAMSRATQRSHRNEKIIRGAQVELEPELTVNYLESYWRSLRTPPMIEGLKKCMCEICQRRRNA